MTVLEHHRDHRTSCRANAIIPKQLHPRFLKALLSSILERISKRVKARNFEAGGFGLVTLKPLGRKKRISLSAPRPRKSMKQFHSRTTSSSLWRLREGITANILSCSSQTRRIQQLGAIKSAKILSRRLGCKREKLSPQHRKFRHLTVLRSEQQDMAAPHFDASQLKRLSSVMSLASRRKV
mmetsp:Transcript_11002/g.21072  ORF Transcript_11002/g.21072 Transcript_11002/m.21072 type:complete len:181 (+) Transcript_11002:458-1000(+)